MRSRYLVKVMPLLLLEYSNLMYARKKFFCYSVLIACCAALVMLFTPSFGFTSDEVMLDLSSLRPGTLPGQVVGLLLSGRGPVLVLKAQGLYGPSDAVVFSLDNTAYRRVYVRPDSAETEGDVITFETRVGPRNFGPVVLATQAALQRHISGSNRLVRLTVNLGLGSAEAEGFLATDIQAIDGTDEFPKVEPLITSATHNCETSNADSDALRHAIDELKRTAQGSSEWQVQSRAVPYVTWISWSREIELICEREMTAEEMSTGIGTVPNISGQQYTIEPSAIYGKVLRARLQVRYLITRDGQIRHLSQTGIEKSISSEPPPPNPAGR